MHFGLSCIKYNISRILKEMVVVLLLSFGILAQVIRSDLGFYLHHPSLSRNCSCHSLLPLGFSLVFFMIFGLEGCISRWLWGSPLLLWSFLHLNSHLKRRFRLQLLRYEVHPSNEGLWHFFYLVRFTCFIFSYIHVDMKKVETLDFPLQEDKQF